MGARVEILFVCGAINGGAAASTLQLADELTRRGDRVAVLRAVRPSSTRRRLYKRLGNLAARLRRTPLWRPAELAARRVGDRLTDESTASGVTVWTAEVVENATATALLRVAPQVVVVNSVDRSGWRRSHAAVRAAGLPVVLYMREESSLGNLVNGMPAPDGLVGNSHALVERASALGFEATFVPSVIDLDRTRVEPRRERVVYINPVPGSGLDLAFAIAVACPDLEFSFVESWRIEPGAWRALEDRAASAGNVRMHRKAADVREIYETASVLLVPYPMDGRPRVVLEAQDSGIPVVATRVAALVEAVGPGGLTVPFDAPTGEWVDALRQVLDPDRYPEWCAAAREHARRDEVATERIVDTFRDAMAAVISGYPSSGAR